LDLRPLRSTRIYRIGKAAKPQIGTTQKTPDRYTYISDRNEIRRYIFGKYPELVEYLIPTGMCTH